MAQLHLHNIEPIGMVCQQMAQPRLHKLEPIDMMRVLMAHFARKGQCRYGCFLKQVIYFNAG